MDEGPTHWARAHSGMRKSCDWTPRKERCWWVTQIALPGALDLHSMEEFLKSCLLSPESKASYQVGKHKNGQLVTITELLSRLHSVAKELPSVLQRGLESNETAQHFLNIFLRLPKGNKVGERDHPSSLLCLSPPSSPRTATVLSSSVRHCNETKLKAISAGKCERILF